MKIFKRATVRFKDRYGDMSKEYNYLTTRSDFERGDLVVVEAREWYQVAVFERYAQVIENASKFIVEAVDIEKLEKDKETIQALEDLMNQIEARHREIEEEKRLEALAAEDDEMAQLVNEYKTIKEEGVDL